MVETLGTEVSRLPWYHTIDLPGGVVTPGRWDTRGALSHVPFPESLAGQQCLDVGTWDGFWAFEMERRGAAEVVAIDLDDVAQWDWPALPEAEVLERWAVGKDEDRAFTIASNALSSKVDRRALSVYDLSPDLVGQFDFAFVGTILLHLRDPVRALSAIRSVVRGELLVADQISLSLSLLQPRSPAAHVAGIGEPHWWTPNIAGLKRLLEAAGFRVVRTGGPYFLRPGPGAQLPAQKTARAQLPAQRAARAQGRGGGVRGRVLGRVGLPHAWVLAQPRDVRPPVR